LNPDQAILIPERQNPLLVHRIVYFLDPTFKKLFDAQKGALPYPPKEVADVQVLAARMEALERRLGERMVVDFVRTEKAMAGMPVAPEPKLAAEIVARKEIKPEPETAMIDDGVPSTPEQAEVAADSAVLLDGLKPTKTISIARMNRFTQKVSELGV
jgi:type IV secretion system protein VirD4